MEISRLLNVIEDKIKNARYYVVFSSWCIGVTTKFVFFLGRKKIIFRYDEVVIKEPGWLGTLNVTQRVTPDDLTTSELRRLRDIWNKETKRRE